MKTIMVTLLVMIAGRSYLRTAHECKFWMIAALDNMIILATADSSIIKKTDISMRNHIGEGYATFDDFYS